MGSVSNQQFAGGCAKAPEEAREDAARAAEEPQLLHGAGICKWFNVRMGFGFLSMTARAGVAVTRRA
ncbi:Protein lin-28 homolog A [Vulpes lagopus]